MQAFASLLSSGSIDLSGLLSHTFDFSNAAVAYQMILDRSEPFFGIVLQYDTKKEVKSTVRINERQGSAQDPSIGLIGAGAFARNFLLPVLDKRVNLTAVATARPHNARGIADKFGFQYCTGNAQEIISDKNINTVFIATRHDSHAEYVLAGLKAGKNVFVEKPLCIRYEDLGEIRKAYSNSQARLMLGFNRRFAPMVKKIREVFPAGQSLAIQYRINAGALPADHWIHNPETGGGRILGEVCHFIDLCTFIAQSEISSLSAQAVRDAGNLSDTLVIGLGFKNGSVASVSYFSNGNKEVNKEYLEVFGSGISAILDDFKTLQIFGRKTERISGNQDKGHEAEIIAFIDAVKKGNPSPIPAEEIFQSTLATFKVLESIAGNGQRIVIQS